jgi:hypothetical protein
MNIEELLADQEALRQAAHWKARYLQAEDRNRDLDEKLRVLTVQLGALKAQLASHSSASLPIPSAHRPVSVSDAENESPIVHSPKSPPNSAAIVARLAAGRRARVQAAIRCGRSRFGQEQCVSLRSSDAMRAFLAQDRELLRSQVNELSAQKQLLTAESVDTQALCCRHANSIASNVTASRIIGCTHRSMMTSNQ